MPYTGARHLLPSIKHVLLHTGQHRLDPHNYGRLLRQCQCRSHVSSPFWPRGSGCGSGRPFHQQGGQWHRSGLPVSQNSGTGQPYRYATFDPLDIPRQVVMLPPLFTRKVGCLEMEMQRVGVQCSGSRFPSSIPRVSPNDGCPICVCRLGLYHEAHSPPVTDTVHATKQRCRGSLRHYISRVLQSPLPRDSSLHDGECVSFRWHLGHLLVDIYFHIPIHRGYRKCLRFQTRDIYQFQALPFGLSPAPWVFTNII